MAVLLGGAASSRKSSLLETQTWLMTNAESAAQEIQQRSAFIVEATLKGIRVGLINYQRMAVRTARPRRRGG